MLGGNPATWAIDALSWEEKKNFGPKNFYQ